MADNNVSVNSVVIPLMSEIRTSSAMMMKHAYLPHTGQKTDQNQFSPYSESENLSQENELSGPNARVYVTKITNQTPQENIDQIFRKDPDLKTNMNTHDIYTLVFSISVQMDDPSTTRFIRGTIDINFPEEIKILDYSPKDKEIVTAIIESGRDTISLSQSLVFLAPAAQGTKIQSEPQENEFWIPVSPNKKMSGTYGKKTGYHLNIPGSFLLEYMGMPKNRHDMFWEIYPPMPPLDIAITGKQMLAIFSLMIQTPKNFPPAINIHGEGRVKGDLWGVVPIKGSGILL